MYLNKVKKGLTEKRKVAVIWMSVPGAAVALSLLLFIRQHQHLRETIERERITYVSEIKNQMIGNNSQT